MNEPLQIVLSHSLYWLDCWKGITCKMRNLILCMWVACFSGKMCMYKACIHLRYTCQEDTKCMSEDYGYFSPNSCVSKRQTFSIYIYFNRRHSPPFWSITIILSKYFISLLNNICVTLSQTGLTALNYQILTENYLVLYSITAIFAMCIIHDGFNLKCIYEVYFFHGIPETLTNLIRGLKRCVCILIKCLHALCDFNFTERTYTSAKIYSSLWQ